MSEPPNTEGVWERPDARQVSELQRMRRLATGLLLLMLAVFVGAGMGQRIWPWLAYPRAFSEAAVVGACADWFAVTALFRRPFGLPIPHTAIIPRQKQRIGAALGRFIATHFLDPAVVTARIERIDAARWLAGWLTKPETVVRFAGGARALLTPLLERLDENRMRAFSRALVVRGAQSMELAPLLAHVLTALEAEGAYDPAFDLAVSAAAQFLEAHADEIRERATRKGLSWIPGWIDVRLANGIMTQLLAMLTAARDQPDHPWRGEGRKLIGRLTLRLTSDPDLAERCEQFKRKILDDRALDVLSQWMHAEIKSGLLKTLADERGLLANGFDEALPALGRWLAGAPEVRAIVNDWARRLVLGTVVASREDIGDFVSGVVDRWDAETMVRRLELQVGKDLQYIRVNGALVGGLVGLAIYVVCQWLGPGGLSR